MFPNDRQASCSSTHVRHSPTRFSEEPYFKCGITPIWKESLNEPILGMLPTKFNSRRGARAIYRRNVRNTGSTPSFA
jgi:hypothetical protein